MRMSEKVDPKNVTPGGNDKLDPGRYHVEIISIEEKDTDKDKPYTVAEMQVRAGTSEAMINRTIRPRYYWYNTNENVEAMNQEMICLLAIQAGVATREEISAMASAGEVAFDWPKAAGQHVVIEYEHREGKDKKQYHGIKHNCIFTLDDPQVASVPKDEEAAALAGAAEVF